MKRMEAINEMDVIAMMVLMRYRSSTRMARNDLFFNVKMRTNIS